MEEKLCIFYKECLLPELVDPRFSRNQKIRDPQFIQDAIEGNATKEKRKFMNIEDKSSQPRKKQKTIEKENEEVKASYNECSTLNSNDSSTEKTLKRNQDIILKPIFNENNIDETMDTFVREMQFSEFNFFNRCSTQVAQNCCLRALEPIRLLLRVPSSSARACTTDLMQQLCSQRGTTFCSL
ncbi:hypothetical protein B5X24_HaOG209673 [Helicoverpa armigera]|uniref:Uncharacterized protein n=1 Tax=Helicoverpa armigera TaxID=29058 RepID=A0A2W1BNV6_HELAM|nr:hypothetical protein B5X24_HaOG209673 [Helicoverpa armigera]